MSTREMSPISWNRLVLTVNGRRVDPIFPVWGEDEQWVRDEHAAEAWERMTFGGLKVAGVLRVNIASWEWVVDAVD